MTTERKNRRRRAQAGVTLIEMLVVMVIIGLIVALVGPNLFKELDKSRVKAAKTEMHELLGAVGAYNLDVGTFPTTEQGLQALREKPANATVWNGPYIPKDIPKDPWGHDYVYRYPGEHGDQPEIVCLGRDGQPGGEGVDADIFSWK